MFSERPFDEFMQEFPQWMDWKRKMSHARSPNGCRETGSISRWPRTICSWRNCRRILRCLTDFPWPISSNCVSAEMSKSLDRRRGFYCTPKRHGTISRLIDWLIDQVEHWMMDCSIDWLIDQVLYWLMDCLIDWLIDWLIDPFFDFIKRDCEVLSFLIFFAVEKST